jgi:membrane associated rhomboid family serine protease
MISTQAQPAEQSSATKRYKIILAIWTAAALAVTASGLYNEVPAPAIQGSIAGLTLALVLFWLISKPFCE